MMQVYEYFISHNLTKAFESLFGSVTCLPGCFTMYRIRALAVTGGARSPALPDVPTVAESGFPGFEVVTWQGLLAAAGTPEPVLARLHAETRTAMARPEVSDNLRNQGFELATGSRADFAALIRSEAARWPAIVRASGARVD